MCTLCVTLSNPIYPSKHTHTHGIIPELLAVILYIRCVCLGLVCMFGSVQRSWCLWVLGLYPVVLTTTIPRAEYSARSVNSFSQVLWCYSIMMWSTLDTNVRSQTFGV